ncbi:class I SAM-dependent methyltransferase [Desulfogranum japonicum]|uniref:class I SAM-dependent methyltransferase n=1 Tax=Desulfogranum japonicum TaxID=231447 RepID=UPI000414AB87|nr:methyltransferase domain-containing protein [Desulfogranum japonicum]
MNPEEIMAALPDKYGIVPSQNGETSNVNAPFSKKFNVFALFYDFIHEHFTRPCVHKADPRRHREILANLIAPVQEATVLDVACGTGCAIVHFHESNDYTGLDIAYGMLKQAAKKGNKKSFKSFRLIQGNAEKLLFEDESFDCVLMDTAMHMIPNYQEAIMEISRVLVKEGTFVCGTPAVGIHPEFDTTWKKMAAKHSLHSLTVSDIENACKQAGIRFRLCDTNGGIVYFQADKSQ